MLRPRGWECRAEDTDDTEARMYQRGAGDGDEERGMRRTDDAGDAVRILGDLRRAVW